MNQKEAREVREQAYGLMQHEGIAFGDFQVYCRIQEGVVMHDGQGNYALIKVIMKKEPFAEEVDLLREEYENKLKAQAEREKEKAAKAEKKEG